MKNYLRTSISTPSSAQPVLCAAVAFLLAAGCGAEASLGDSQVEANSPTDSAGEAAPEDPAATGPSGNTFGAVVDIPGFQRQEYPGAPYGFTTGTTIQDLDFFGWADPIAAGFDVSRVSEVRMSDFYNPGPAGEGTELLMVNAVAVWCGACRIEYAEFGDEQVYAEFNPRGLEMLGVLFEDTNRNPAAFADLANWAATFDVPFPFVLDPGFKTGVFFDGAATPMNLIVDARTMEILASFVGWNPEIFDVIDAELSRRGR